MTQQISFKSKSKEQNPIYFCCRWRNNDPATISKKFNNYFVEIGPKLTRNLNSSINPLSYLDNNTNSIFFPEISQNEILGTVNSLKNISAGWDHIPTFIAKRSLQYYLKPLTHLINKSIHKAYFQMI